MRDGISCQSWRGFDLTAIRQNSRALCPPGGRFIRPLQSSNHPTTNPQTCTSLRERLREASRSSRQFRGALRTGRHGGTVLTSRCSRKHLAMTIKKCVLRFHGNFTYPKNPATLKKAYLLDWQFLKQPTSSNSRNQNQSPSRLQISALRDQLSEFV